MEKFLNPVARLFIAHIFLLSGLSKIGQYAGTQAYMEAMGVPGALLPAVILLEVVAAVMLIVGWQTRWAALGLAGFTIISAIIFHANFADQTHMIMFMKNGAITGGLLLLAANGAGYFSVDNHRSRQRQMTHGHAGATA